MLPVLLSGCFCLAVVVSVLSMILLLWGRGWGGVGGDKMLTVYQDSDDNDRTERKTLQEKRKTTTITNERDTWLFFFFFFRSGVCQPKSNVSPETNRQLLQLCWHADGPLIFATFAFCHYHRVFFCILALVWKLVNMIHIMIYYYGSNIYMWLCQTLAWTTTAWICFQSACSFVGGGGGGCRLNTLKPGCLCRSNNQRLLWPGCLCYK